MMPSRKSEAGISRPRQKPPKQIGMTQLFLVGAAVVVVIVLALLLFGSRGKKSTARPLRTVAASEESGTRAPRRTSARATRTRNAQRDEERAKLREERLQRRQEAKSGGRTARSSSGGFTSGGSARAGSVPNRLRAILTDNTGARTALVGERRLRAGDDIEGRRIVEVSGDGIKVEYRQNTYSVRVGEAVY
jgi:hypothetical protein